MLKGLVTTVVVALGGIVCAVGPDGFRTPENDLPTAIVNGYEVAFNKNGSFVVGKGGKWLFDGGLGFATSGWKVWGTQIRRSEADNEWELVGGYQLSFRGTLCDTDRDPWFAFEQHVVSITEGLRFRYEVTPLKGKSAVSEFGLVFHLPAAHAKGSGIGFWPGFRAVSLPADKGKAQLVGPVDSRAVEWRRGGEKVFSAVGQADWRWQVFDDRNWELNTFRAISGVASLAASLKRGQAGSLEFELLLGEGAEGNLPQPPARWTQDRYGRIACGLGDRKLLEGGAYLGESPSDWLFGGANMAGAVRRAGDGSVKSDQVGKVDGQGVRTRSTLELSEGRLSVAQRVGHAGEAGEKGETGLSFAAPLAQVPTEPALEGDGAPDSGGERRVRIEASLGTFFLRTQAAVSISEARVAGERVWLIALSSLPSADANALDDLVSASVELLPKEAKP